MKKENTPISEDTGRPQHIDVEAIDEAVQSAVVLAFGRMNPPTIGHQKLVDKLQSVAKKNKATPQLYLSHTQNKKKDPLSYNDKYKIAKKAFGNIVIKSNAKTIIDVLKSLNGKYDRVIYVAGSDRVGSFEKLMNDYNGKEYNFESIQVISAGERDPDADGVEGMSASKLRALAVAGEYQQFRQGVPKKLTDADTKKMYDQIRAGLGISEEMSLDEVLTVQQRMKRRIAFRRIKSKIKRSRDLAKRRMAKPENLKKRASKQARDALRKKLAGSRAAKYKDLPLAARAEIDKKIEKKKSLVSRMAKRMLPKVRKAEQERLKKYRQNRTSSASVKEETIDYLYAIDSVMRIIEQENINEKVIKNLQKKSERYDVSFEELRNFYIEEKGIYNQRTQEVSENVVFQSLNSLLARKRIAEAEEGSNETQAKQAIRREKETDRIKHDKMLDRARLDDTKEKNRMTRPRSNS